MGASLTPGASPGITETGSALCGLKQRQVALVPLRLQALDRNEAQRSRVDAVAQPRRRRTVVEQMSQVRISVGRSYLGPHHEERPIGLLADVRVLERLREARPPRARLELVERAEERLPGHQVHV